jgi:hypothetical protein
MYRAGPCAAGWTLQFVRFDSGINYRTNCETTGFRDIYIIVASMLVVQTPL